MHPLHNEVQHYRWGSRTDIADLCRRDFGDERVAEMWFGAHPLLPSRLDSGISLVKAIEADPKTLLGPAVRARYGDRLPYLMKLLAADEPLSLQVHPRRADAEAGYADEERRMIPRDGDERTYRDPSHKPELVYALGRFTALIGFRERGETAGILRSFGLSWLDDLADRVGTPSVELHSVVASLLHVPRADVVELVASIRAAATRCADATVAGAVDVLADRYPDDPAVLVALLLNVVDLAPGQAAFVAPGVVHSYLRGFAVEIQASSDNVVRAGLTDKHVDVDLLLRTAEFSSGGPVIVEPRSDGAAVQVFEPKVGEFELLVLETTAGRVGLDAHGPQIVLCLEGAVDVAGRSDSRALGAGDAVFVEHGESVEVRGEGRAVVAQVPQ